MTGSIRFELCGRIMTGEKFCAITSLREIWFHFKSEGRDFFRAKAPRREERQSRRRFWVFDFNGRYSWLEIQKTLRLCVFARDLVSFQIGRSGFFSRKGAKMPRKARWERVEILGFHGKKLEMKMPTTFAPLRLCARSDSFWQLIHCTNNFISHECSAKVQQQPEFFA